MKWSLTLVIFLVPPLCCNSITSTKTDPDFKRFIKNLDQVKDVKLNKDSKSLLKNYMNEQKELNLKGKSKTNQNSIKPNLKTKEKLPLQTSGKNVVGLMQQVEKLIKKSIKLSDRTIPDFTDFNFIDSKKKTNSQFSTKDKELPTRSSAGYGGTAPDVYSKPSPGYGGTAPNVYSKPSPGYGSYSSQQQSKPYKYSQPDKERQPPIEHKPLKLKVKEHSKQQGGKLLDIDDFQSIWLQMVYDVHELMEDKNYMKDNHQNIKTMHLLFDMLQSTSILVEKKKKPLCPYSYDTAGSLCLSGEYLTESLNYYEARMYCQTIKGGDLVIIRNACEFREIVEYLEEIDPYHTKNYWIGASDRKNEGIWKNTDGSILPLGPPFWGKVMNKLEPSGKDPFTKEEQDYGMMLGMDHFYIHDVSDDQGVDLYGIPLCQYLPQRDHFQKTEKKPTGWGPYAAYNEWRRHKENSIFDNYFSPVGAHNKPENPFHQYEKFDYKQPEENQYLSTGYPQGTYNKPYEENQETNPEYHQRPMYKPPEENPNTNQEYYQRPIYKPPEENPYTNQENYQRPMYKPPEENPYTNQENYQMPMYKPPEKTPDTNQEYYKKPMYKPPVQEYNPNLPANTGYPIGISEHYPDKDQRPYPPISDGYQGGYDQAHLQYQSLMEQKPNIYGDQDVNCYACNQGMPEQPVSQFVENNYQNTNEYLGNYVNPPVEYIPGNYDIQQLPDNMQINPNPNNYPFNPNPNHYPFNPNPNNYPFRQGNSDLSKKNDNAHGSIGNAGDFDPYSKSYNNQGNNNEYYQNTNNHYGSHQGTGNNIYFRHINTTLNDNIQYEKNGGQMQGIHLPFPPYENENVDHSFIQKGPLESISPNQNFIFHNGSPLTAQLHPFSSDHIIDPNSGNAGEKLPAHAVSSITGEKLPAYAVSSITGEKPPAYVVSSITGENPPAYAVSSITGEKPPAYAVSSITGEKPPGYAVSSITGEKPPAYAVSSITGENPPAYAVSSITGEKPPAYAVSSITGEKPPAYAVSSITGEKPPAYAVSIITGEKPPAYAVSSITGEKPPAYAVSSIAGDKPPAYVLYVQPTRDTEKIAYANPGRPLIDNTNQLNPLVKQQYIILSNPPQDTYKPPMDDFYKISIPSQSPVIPNQHYKTVHEANDIQPHNVLNNNYLFYDHSTKSSTGPNVVQLPSLPEATYPQQYYESNSQLGLVTPPQTLNDNISGQSNVVNSQPVIYVIQNPNSLGSSHPGVHVENNSNLLEIPPVSNYPNNNVVQGFSPPFSQLPFQSQPYIQSNINPPQTDPSKLHEVKEVMQQISPANSQLSFEAPPQYPFSNNVQLDYEAFPPLSPTYNPMNGQSPSPTHFYNPLYQFYNPESRAAEPTTISRAPISYHSYKLEYDDGTGIIRPLANAQEYRNQRNVSENSTVTLK